MKKVYIFPRYSGSESSDWYPYLERVFEKDPVVSILPLSLPNWNRPNTAEFLAFIRTAIPVGQLDRDTYFVGHSVGCLAVLLYLSELHKKHPDLRIGGILCVAGWLTVDEPWPQLQQWIQAPIDYERVKTVASNNIHTLISTNDPFSSNYGANQQQWEQTLNARVVVAPDAAHFNDPKNEAVVEQVRALLSGS